MTQLFQNLIENGIKYNKSKTPTVQIGYKQNNGFHNFSIKDNGIGIEEQYLDDVFKMFKRLHNISEYEGTGIGLALCKKIIESNGGEIVLQSKIGVGSEVSIKMPCSSIGTRSIVMTNLEN